MKKAYRIKKEREFQHVYHHAQTYANRQLVLYVYPKPEQAHFRGGLSGGKTEEVAARYKKRHTFRLKGVEFSLKSGNFSRKLVDFFHLLGGWGVGVCFFFLCLFLKYFVYRFNNAIFV